MEPKCRVCKQNKSNMTSWLVGKHRQYMCRECNTEKLRRYRKTKSGIEATRRAVRKYETNHPERKPAWSKAQAIKREPCAVCGDPNTHRHHPDINKPLEVISLCPLHHKAAESAV